MTKLRDYQELAHTQLVERLKENLSTLLVMATGSGKSKTLVSFIKKYEKHFIFILIVQNRKLVNQLAEDTKEFGLDYGVFMASHDELDTSKKVQVCSIDTINTRGEYPHIKSEKDIIVIIDEADQAKAQKFQSAIKRYNQRKKIIPQAGRTFLIGMTATPYNKLGDVFDTYINPITAIELRRRGFLVDYKYFIPRDSVDYKNIIVKRGEWSAIQVSRKLNNPSMIKSCFDSWLRHGEDRQTLIFCMDKKHAEAMCEYINEYYKKIMAKFVYDKTTDKERKGIFDDFESGRIRFLVNIRIITRGVDLPCIGSIIDCAATLNLNLHIQKLGRGSRKNDFYKDCIVIDPAKNVLNNGHFYQEREIDLNKEYKKVKSDLQDLFMRYCENCFRADEAKKFVNGKCPFCGHSLKQPVKKKLSKYKKDQLFMEQATEAEIEARKMINDYKKILWKKKNLGKTYRNDIAVIEAHKAMMKKYGVKECLKVAKQIKLLQKTVDAYVKTKEKTYVPLGGMKL